MGIKMPCKNCPSEPTTYLKYEEQGHAIRSTHLLGMGNKLQRNSFMYDPADLISYVQRNTFIGIRIFEV